MAGTPHYDADAYFFDSRMNEEEGCWEYRLPENVCEAVELEKLA